MSKNKKHYYPEANQNVDFSKMEEEVLKFWNENNIFEKSIEQRENKDKNKEEEFVFYDGPPFANGLPHYGHLLTGYTKDAFARYQTMNGKKVDRRFGWDCHGLPAEMGVEKESGISGKQAIEEYGIKNFNNLCKESVLRYTNEWKSYVARMGRWVDFDGGYKTMDNTYMESVIWVFKQLYDKGLLYEDFRVMPYSWMCQTPLSNFETTMDNSYRERADKAITVKFEIDFENSLSGSKSEKMLDELREKVKQDSHKENTKLYLLAWTTTPWTLPSNLALTVGLDINYVLIKKDGEYYILGKDTLPKYSKDLNNGEEGKFEILANFKGNDMIGWKYKPLFPYLLKLQEVQNSQNVYTIIHADFVTTTDGTGIVHTAPGFGEDDQNACKQFGIPTICPVDEKGCFDTKIFEE